VNEARRELGLIGRRAKTLDVGEPAELAPGELDALLDERGAQKPVSIKRLAARHHALARALATGTKPGEAAILCGLTASRVSILMSDPMFQDLQAHYANAVDAKFLGMQEKMAALGEDMVDEIAERLEDNPTAFSVDELYKGAALMADRTGNGPSQKSEVSVRIGIGDRLEAAAKRLASARGQIIDITPEIVE